MKNGKADTSTVQTLQFRSSSQWEARRSAFLWLYATLPVNDPVPIACAAL